jgi:hypothetical protein
VQKKKVVIQKKKVSYQKKKSVVQKKKCRAIKKSFMQKKKCGVKKKMPIYRSCNKKKGRAKKIFCFAGYLLISNKNIV